MEREEERENVTEKPAAIQYETAQLVATTTIFSTPSTYRIATDENDSGAQNGREKEITSRDMYDCLVENWCGLDKKRIEKEATTVAGELELWKSWKWLLREWNDFKWTHTTRIKKVR